MEAVMDVLSEVAKYGEERNYPVSVEKDRSVAIAIPGMSDEDPFYFCFELITLLGEPILQVEVPLYGAVPQDSFSSPLRGIAQFLSDNITGKIVFVPDFQNNTDTLEYIVLQHLSGVGDMSSLCDSIVSFTLRLIQPALPLILGVYDEDSYLNAAQQLNLLLAETEGSS